MTVATRTTSDYEELRAAVLGAGLIRGPDLGTVRHRGLANWLRQPPLTPIAQQPCSERVRTPDALADPTPVSTELTRLIAGIVVALAVEQVHG